jgi:small conductance mechanosensitive channel
LPRMDGNLSANPVSHPFSAFLHSQSDMLAARISSPSLDILFGSLYSIDPLSLMLNLFIILLIIALTIVAAKIVDQMLRRSIPRITSQVEVKMDETVTIMIRRLASAIIYAFGFMLVILQIPQLRSLATAMLAGAGLAGLAIGYAARDSLSNFTSGIFIAIFQPIRVGDYVDFRGDFGQIEDLTLRHTVIRTWDNRRVIVPNCIVSTEPIINWTIKEPEVIWPIDLAVARASDIDRARDILLKEASLHPSVLKDRETSVLLTDAKDGNYSLRLFARFSSRSTAYRAGCEIREAATTQLEREGIAISK